MELLSINSEFLEVPENFVHNLRASYGFDKPKKLEESLDLLENWIEKQSHFKKKKFNRRYLETCLLSCKGSVERTKKRIENLCILRTMLPEFYTEFNLEQALTCIEKVVGGILPKLSNGSRVFIIRTETSTLTYQFYKEYFKYVLSWAEYLRLHDYCDGYTIIFDISSSDLFKLLTTMNISQFRNLIAILLKGYGMRLSALHVLISPSTLSKAIDLSLSLAKIIHKLLAERLHMHKSIDTLYEHVQQDILPVEYGGKENFTMSDLNVIWWKIASAPETVKFVNEMNQAKVDESYTRKASNKFDEYLGLPGSFRQLDFD